MNSIAFFFFDNRFPLFHFVHYLLLYNNILLSSFLNILFICISGNYLIMIFLSTQIVFIYLSVFFCFLCWSVYYIILMNIDFFLNRLFIYSRWSRVLYPRYFRESFLSFSSSSSSSSSSLVYFLYLSFHSLCLNEKVYKKLKNTMIIRPNKSNKYSIQMR